VNKSTSRNAALVGRARTSVVTRHAATNSIAVEHGYYAGMVMLITLCCVVIEVFSPEAWQPDLVWLVAAPGCGLVFGAIPALLVHRRSLLAERRSREQEDLIGLLLRDYAAERGDWVWSCDTEGKLRAVSAKFADHADRDADALEGMSLLEFMRGTVAAGDPALEQVAMALRQRRPFYDVEARIGAGADARRWRLAGKPIFRDGRFAGFIGTAGDITTELLARETMTFLAYNDGLTGLSNRSHFTARLNDCVARLERYGSAFSLLYLDLDKFKAVNDSLGHQAGDRLLVEVGRRLGALLRQTDVVARLGGDEFGILLTDDADPANLGTLSTRLVEAVNHPYTIDGEELSIGLSVGIAIAPINGTRPDQLLRNADLALYRAKAEGGTRWCFFQSSMDDEVRERRVLEMELNEALQRDEFTLHYQPVVAPASGRVSGFEALIRWNHPIRGMVPPVEFIPLAERSGQIARIGEWTIAEACKALTLLPEHQSVAVNLSTKHFRSADMASIVERALKATGVAPRRLELEITESLLIEDPREMARKLGELKRIGVLISMDDFGTGYSSLSYLLKFPFDKIKIDRSFVTASSENAAAREILKAIVMLARNLKIAVTSEGVETAEQAAFLSQTGSNLLQGYLFGKPVPLSDLPALVARIEASVQAPDTPLVAA
jgi:diguanylate cyclase (GGDEF)-like protein